MHSARTFGKNLILTVASIVAVFVLTLAADKVAGRFTKAPALPGSMELIFPPNAEQSYASADFSYTAHINRMGVRDREIPRERTDAYRIIAIGDSYTYGWGVEIEQTWLRLLEERLQKDGRNVETINLGKPGSGPPFYAELAERAIPVLRPDLVIVGILQGNDLSASGPEGLEGAKKSVLDNVRLLYPNFVRMIEDAQLARSYETRTQERPPQKSSAEDNRRWTANTAKEFLDKMPPEHRARFDAFEDKVKEAFLSGNLNPYMIDLAMQNPRFYGVTSNPDDDWTKNCVNHLIGHLNRIKRMAERYNAQVIVVTIPDGPYVNEHAFKNIQRVGYEMDPAWLGDPGPDQGVKTACDAVGLPCVQVSKTFLEHRDDPNLYFELDGHLTAAGHRLYAEAIAPLIEKLLPSWAGKS